MRLTELREGTHVIDLSGEDLGKIERFVIDPSTRDVTHVVIEKGVVFPEERVAPVHALHDTDDDHRLQLDESVEADELPLFEERHYVDLGDKQYNSTEAAPYPAAAWAYPMIPTPGFPAYPTLAAPVGLETKLNVPQGSVVVSEGSEVYADNGESVGRVKEVGTDEAGQLAYIVVNPGWFQSERIIPGHWVQTIDDAGVRLALTVDALERHDRDRR